MTARRVSFRGQGDGAYDRDMSDREKPPSRAGDAPPIDPELLAYLNGPPPQDENGVDLSLIRETLSMSLEERAARHYEAHLFTERMRAMGEEYYGQLLAPPKADE